MSFRVEYRRGSATMFQRNVRFQVDIIKPDRQANEDANTAVYTVTFTLIQGKSAT